MFSQRLLKQLQLSNAKISRLSRHFCSPASNIQNPENQLKNDAPIAGEATADFGFEKVTTAEKAQKVYGVFEAVASNYDVMNDAMSAGVHRVWKDYFVRKLLPIRPGTQILDVAGGTGDIAFRIAKNIELYNKKNEISVEDSKRSSIVVSDINEAMLEVGQKRALQLDLSCPEVLSWLCADAQELPLEDDRFDVYTIAFGIRNVVDVQKALDEAYRVLKPGGRFMCLEFSHVENPAIKWVYDKYSFQVIPPMGELIAGDWKSYQYLVESIRKFPTQEKFKMMIEEAGFRCVSYQNLTFGVVAIHSGYKI